VLDRGAGDVELAGLVGVGEVGDAVRPDAFRVLGELAQVVGRELLLGAERVRRVPVLDRLARVDDRLVGTEIGLPVVVARGRELEVAVLGELGVGHPGQAVGTQALDPFLAEGEQLLAAGGGGRRRVGRAGTAATAAPGDDECGEKHCGRNLFHALTVAVAAAELVRPRSVVRARPALAM
jgi:hypothetical protein